jgi:Fur family ferric uptake transcriptional regulator
MKSTRQRTAIAQALSEAEGFRSAQELHEELRTRGKSIGLATVYRNLQAMAERGEVDSLRREDGESVYRRCDSEGHHHHLVCRSCGYSVEVDNAKVEGWAESIGKRHGFEELTHDVEIFGICSLCRR